GAGRGWWGRSQAEFYLIGGCGARGPGVAFGFGEVAGAHGQLVVDARVEVGDVVDPVDDVDEFAEEEAGGYSDTAAEFSGDGLGEVADVGVVDAGADPVGGFGSVGVQVADGGAELVEPVEVEAGEADLDGPQVVVARVGHEVGGEPLGEGGEALHALRPVVEGGGAGDDEVEAGEAAGGDFVDELAERVEGFVAGVGAGALQGFEFVEDDEEPRVAAVAEQGEEALEGSEGPGVVEVAFDSGVAFRGGGHVGLSAEPGDERVGDGVLPFGLGAVVAAEGKGHGGAAAGDSGEALFEEFRDGLGEGVFVAAGHSAVVEDVFFEGVDPVVDDFSEGAGRLGGGGEAFGEPPVDGFEPVQRGFGFGDLDFGD